MEIVQARDLNPRDHQAIDLHWVLSWLVEQEYIDKEDPDFLDLWHVSACEFIPLVEDTYNFTTDEGEHVSHVYTELAGVAVPQELEIPTIKVWDD